MPTAYNCAFEGTAVSAFAFLRMMFLDEVAFPVCTERRHAETTEGDCPEGTIAIKVPGCNISRFSQVQRAGDLALRALSSNARKGHRGNSAHIPSCPIQVGMKSRRILGLPEVNEANCPPQQRRRTGGQPDCNTRNNRLKSLVALPDAHDRRTAGPTGAAGEYRGGISIIRENTF